MSAISAARDRFTALAITSFGLTGDTVMDVGAAEKIDWRQLMSQVEAGTASSGIVPPYAVLIFGPAIPFDGALPSRTYQMECHGVFITSTRTGSTAKTQSEVRTEIEDALIAFQSALLGDTNGALQTWESEVNCDQSNPANAYYMEFAVPLYAGILRANIICGTVAP